MKYLSAEQVAQALGVSRTTVYAYVSRGLLRSEAAGGNRRERRYSAEDVQQLRQRQARRRHPEQAVAEALHWGTPILDSALTLIADGRLYYRGRDAVALAEAHGVEDVAALLWTGHLDARAAGLDKAMLSPLPARCRALLPRLADLPPIERFQVLLPLAAGEDLGAYDLRPAAAAQTGARLLRLLVAIAAGAPAPGAPLARALAQAWAPAHTAAERLFNLALVLCADHELNVSAFTARCAASAGATPYAVVSAGLAALSGVRHGGATGQVEALFQEARSPGGARAAMGRLLKRGQALPGFGHRLYPDGDPRGRALVEAVRAARPRARATRLAQALIEEAQSISGEAPTIDFGLVLLAEALELPPGTALGLFALGRSIGYVAHALEEYAAGRMIRPRAKYVGEVPGGER